MKIFVLLALTGGLLQQMVGEFTAGQQYVYKITFQTCAESGSSTDTVASVELDNGHGGKLNKTVNGSGDVFAIGRADTFNATSTMDLGRIQGVTISKKGFGGAWKLKCITVNQGSNERNDVFTVGCNRTVSISRTRYIRDPAYDWTSWGSCSCTTGTRNRTRRKCLEQDSTLERESCKLHITSCGNRKLVIILSSTSGALMLILVFVGGLYLANRSKRSRPSPTVRIVLEEKDRNSYGDGYETDSIKWSQTLSSRGHLDNLSYSRSLPVICSEDTGNSYDCVV